jgi:DNA-binding transcriptional LysR family regulator
VRSWLHIDNSARSLTTSPDPGQRTRQATPSVDRPVRWRRSPEALAVELRQLEYFLAVVEEGSFTRAAARLYMSQSSLSASLLGLERELGSDLFIRGRRGAELTDAGRALVGPARDAIGDIERARQVVGEVTGLIRGTVRVATVAVPPEVDVTDTVQAFQRRHPEVRVHVLHDGAADLLGLVMESQVDFAVTPLTRRTASGLRFERLLGSPMAAIYPAGHRFAGAREVDVRDLLDELVIDLPRGWWPRDLFERMLGQRRLQREVRVEVNEWFGALTMVQRGVGVAYGPRDCVDRTLFCDLGMATLADAPLWELGIVTRNETLRGAAGRVFLDAYRERCRRLLGASGAPPTEPPPASPSGPRPEQPRT